MNLQLSQVCFELISPWELGRRQFDALPELLSYRDVRRNLEEKEDTEVSFCVRSLEVGGAVWAGDWQLREARSP